jgi:beta-glucosidase
MAPSTFPPGFLWGTASASYQIEGAWNADGKGESIWDRFSHTPGKIKKGDNGDVANDFYHKFPEDIAMMADLGLNAARISLSWPRIMPTGKGAVNQKGLDFYRRVIDQLLAHKIQPWVTLYHWDLPQALEDAGGWPNRDLAEIFRDYAAVVADALGDRVKHWMTFNEPWIFTILGYYTGIHAPGRREREEAMKATHVVSLAQGMAVRALREAREKPIAVGTAFSMAPVHPHNHSSLEDRAAAERWHRFSNLWFLDPVMNGRYPEIYLEGSATDHIGLRDGDLEIVKAPLDFIGINLYTRAVVSRDSRDQTIGVKQMRTESKDVTEFGWEIYPAALSEMILRVTRDFGRIPIYVTENGCSFGDGPDASGKVNDQRRISFMRRYIAEVGRAIEAGADVRGYFTWTFTDNFEWAEGLTGQRFGIVHCDFETQKRIIKESGHWYSKVARANALDFDPVE